jgi:putative membrane protein
MMGMGTGFGLWGLLLMVLLWVGLIALAVWLVRALFPQADRSQGGPAVQGPGARDILDRRYARGEITREEYEVIRETLSQ